MEVGDRLLGKDGTHRKVLVIGSKKVTTQVGLNGQPEQMTHAALKRWRADPLPDHPEPQEQGDGITVTVIRDKKA